MKELLQIQACTHWDGTMESKSERYFKRVDIQRLVANIDGVAMETKELLCHDLCASFSDRTYRKGW